MLNGPCSDKLAINTPATVAMDASPNATSMGRPAVHTSVNLTVNRMTQTAKGTAKSMMEPYSGASVGISPTLEQNALMKMINMMADTRLAHAYRSTK